MKKKKLIDIFLLNDAAQTAYNQIYRAVWGKFGSVKSKFLKFLAKIDSNVNCILKYFYQ